MGIFIVLLIAVVAYFLISRSKQDKKVADLNQQIDALKAKVKTLTETNNKLEETNKAKLDIQQMKPLELDELINSKQKKISNLEAVIRDLTRDIDKKKSTVAFLEGKADALNNRTTTPATMEPTNPEPTIEDEPIAPTQAVENFADWLNDRKKPRCPKCHSTNVQAVQKHKKNFSMGKAVAGTVLAGGVGSVAGFAGKNTKKVDMVCMDCGNQFLYKR
ncbi:hypothetical protein [Lactobacillus paragasseri]|uniref:Uncharacterized protein n=1 Tax=Lactobacillus paragasseri TaxID=2107999 RepID=A0ABD4ZZA6_9LACO|nr:hypothetical protein [Lactobacillus paragasseri]MDK7952187.1 hypothetical protein [Lactobacillus paragasseri]MDO6360841.1 hypothetical protein [Lactobacillus paragasseri]